MAAPKTEQNRTEERSTLAANKARLTRADRQTEISFLGLDLSTQGLGVLIKGEASTAETVYLIAERVGELALRVVWTRPDLVRPSYSHVGMQAVNPQADLRGFFNKVIMAEEVAADEPRSSSGAQGALDEQLVMRALQGLNTADASLFRKANLTNLQDNHRIYPFMHENRQYCVVVSTLVSTHVLRRGDIELARKHAKFFALAKTERHSSLYQAKLVWPPFNPVGIGPILVADDDDNLLDLMVGFFKKSGFKTLSCKDGEEAVALMKRHPEISAVVTDLKMPKLDGIALIRQARKELAARGNLPPFIVVSGYVTPDVLKQSKALGVNHWFVKPVETGDLLNALSTLLVSGEK